MTGSDLLLVQIIPTAGDAHPTTSAGIVKRINEITFSTSLQHDLDALARLRDLSAASGFGAGAPVRKLRALTLGHLRAQDWVPDLARHDVTDLGRAFLMRLRERGSAAAQDWLDARAAAA